MLAHGRSMADDPEQASYLWRIEDTGASNATSLCQDKCLRHMRIMINSGFANRAEVWWRVRHCSAARNSFAVLLLGYPWSCSCMQGYGVKTTSCTSWYQHCVVLLQDQICM